MVELRMVWEKLGRCFAVGWADPSGLTVERIIKVGNYVTVCFRGMPDKAKKIVLHVDDLRQMVESGVE